MTLSITTLSITTLSKTTPSITTLSITTLSITTLSVKASYAAFCITAPSITKLPQNSMLKKMETIV